jgi:hypothetical protein
MNRFESEKTPQAGAYTGGQLYEAVDQRAHEQHWQAQIHQRPPECHPSQPWFCDSVTHHGLHRMAFKQSFPHARMVTNTESVV